MVYFKYTRRKVIKNMLPYYKTRAHPAGDERSGRLLSIIRMSCSLAGYDNRYPFIADSVHKGTLTRPEQMQSPVYGAFRQHQRERQRRYPATKRAREAPANEAQYCMPRPEWDPIQVQRTIESRFGAKQEDEPEANRSTSSTTVDTEKPTDDTQRGQDQNNDAKSDDSVKYQRTWTERIMGLFRQSMNGYRKVNCKSKKNDTPEEADREENNTEIIDKEGNDKSVKSEEPEQSTSKPPKARRGAARLFRAVRRRAQKIFRAPTRTT